MASAPQKSYRRFDRLGIKLVAATLVVLLVGFFGASVHTISSEEQMLTEQLDARGKELAALGASSCIEMMMGSDYPKLDTFVANLAHKDDDILYCRVDKPDGTKASEGRGDIVSGAFDTEAYQEYEADIVFTETSAKDAKPLLLGRIRLGVSMRSLALLKAQRSRTLALQGGISFAVLACVLLVFLRRSVSKPVESLDRQATLLGKGDLDTPISLSSRDELGRLAETLDSMRQNLRASYGEIRANNDELRRIGELKDRALEDLATALEAATAANKAKDEFLATISHELRTPMNGVIGMTQLLMSTNLDREQREYAEAVCGSAEGLLLMVNDVLDFSRLNAGRMDLVQVATDMPALLRSVSDLFAPRAAEKGLAFNWTVDPAVPAWARIDPQRFRQVLVSLVGNAIKFTSQGAVTVAIGVQARAGSRVELRATIADTGIGISAGGRAKLFQPFMQADGSLSRSHDGTGLGLAIAKRLVEKMGGTIAFESEEGRGSVFWFTVACVEVPAARTASDPAPRNPLTSAESAALIGSVPAALPSPRTAPAPAPGANGAAQVRILLVEDNPVNQRIAARMLEKLGYTVEVAAHGVEALERHAQGGYALVLMDVSMPVMDGLEATRRIREREATSGEHVPIVALTANAMEGDRKRCLGAGMDEYLTKPVRSESLSDTVARFVSAPRAA